MKWYADNSELSGIKEAEIPDILLFGGVVLGADAEKQFQSEVETVKKRYRPNQVEHEESERVLSKRGQDHLI